MVETSDRSANTTRAATPGNPSAAAMWPHLTPKDNETNADREYQVALLRHLRLCGIRKKGR
jgi:hypothetical protein